MGDRDTQKTTPVLNSLEAEYDRGYDDGFAARDKLASTHSYGDNFTSQVVRVLREVGLLGNTVPCP